MRVLAIDLGGELVGWAVFDGAVLYQAGTWTIYDRRRTESPGMRWIRLRSALSSALGRLGFDPHDPRVVAYEEVRNHTSHRPEGRAPTFNVAAAHAYGGAQAILLAWCAENHLEVKSQPIATVKAAATGLGGGKGTDKAAVLAAAEARWPSIGFVDYNASDAAFIGWAALIELGLAPPTPRPERLKPPKKSRKTTTGPDGPTLAGGSEP